MCEFQHVRNGWWHMKQSVHPALDDHPTFIRNGCIRRYAGGTWKSTWSCWVVRRRIRFYSFSSQLFEVFEIFVCLYWFLSSGYNLESSIQLWGVNNNHGFWRSTGDKRSFSMMNICANRLAGETRKGWAVANVVAEMCEALVSSDYRNFFGLQVAWTPKVAIAPGCEYSSNVIDYLENRDITRSKDFTRQSTDRSPQDISSSPLCYSSSVVNIVDVNICNHALKKKTHPVSLEDTSRF